MSAHLNSTAPVIYKVIGGDIGKEIGDISKAALVKLGVAADDYRLVMSAYPGNRQIALKKELNKLARRHKAKVFQLFGLAVATVQAGQQPALSDHQDVDLRMFFPALPPGFCSFHSFRDAVNVTERMAQINHRAAQLRERKASDEDVQTEVDHIWAGGAPLEPRPEKPIEVAATDTKAQIKHEVTFCGERIWPSEFLKDVTFADMNTGWHLVHHWVNTLEHTSPQRPKEVAKAIRALTHDLAEATSIAGLRDVMLACISAYSKHNDEAEKADLSNSVPPGLAR